MAQRGSNRLSPREVRSLAWGGSLLVCGGWTPLFFSSAGVLARFGVRRFLRRFGSQRSGGTEVGPRAERSRRLACLGALGGRGRPIRPPRRNAVARARPLRSDPQRHRKCRTPKRAKRPRKPRRPMAAEEKRRQAVALQSGRSARESPGGQGPPKKSGVQPPHSKAGETPAKAPAAKGRRRKAASSRRTPKADAPFEALHVDHSMRRDWAAASEMGATSRISAGRSGARRPGRTSTRTLAAPRSLE